MGLAATAAKLLASLDLDTKPFEQGAARVGGTLGKMEGRFSRIGTLARQGISNAANNLKRIGLIAGGFLVSQVTMGVRSLEELERVTNATAGVIESTGGKAGVTAQQVRELAQSLEQVTTADDKVIQSGQNLLLTFTQIGSEIFPQATKAMVDMGIAMAQGDVANADFKSSAIQLGKALNDPIRGMSALRRVGVSFTEEQEDRVKKLVEAGKIMEAQKLILAELEIEFGKAGEAAGKGFGADMRRFKDAVEDGQQALAIGFLPIITRVSKFLTERLSDPRVMNDIRRFGDHLADAFDQILQIGSKLPWQQIGDSFKIMGTGAKALLDAFTSLPDWLQTAVLTGWGLNKLTGGALGKIGLELVGGQGGLFSRGASPATPMFTKEVGVAGGAGGPAVIGGKAGILGSLLRFIGLGAGLGLLAGSNAGQQGGGLNETGFLGNVGGGALTGAAIAGPLGALAGGLIGTIKSVAETTAANSKAQTQQIADTLTKSLAGPNTVSDLQTKLAGIDYGIQQIQSNPLAVLVHGEALAELQAMRSQVVAAIEAGATNTKNAAAATTKVGARLDRLYHRTGDPKEPSKAAQKIIESQSTISKKQASELDRMRNALVTAQQNARSAIVSAGRSDRAAIVGAIRANRPIVNISVTNPTVRIKTGGTNYYSGQRYNGKTVPI